MLFLIKEKMNIQYLERYAFIKFLKRGPWLGIFKCSSSWMITSALNLAGCFNSSVSKVNLPFDEQLAHLYFMARVWILDGWTLILIVQASIYALGRFLRLE